MHEVLRSLARIFGRVAHREAHSPCTVCRSTIGPVIVDDLDQLLARATAFGARITGGPHPGPTGRFAYLDHPDGTNVEYVEWSASIRARVLG